MDNQANIDKKGVLNVFDYHVHTPLCKHATGTPAQMVQAAFEKGLEGIAFLDHLALPPLPGNNSMQANDIPLYMNTIRSLEEAWKGKIQVLCGLEMDFHPESLPLIRKTLENFDFDIVGGSVHFVEGYNIASRKSRSSWAHLSAFFLYEAYLDAVEEMIKADFCDVLCHLDLMEKFAPDLSQSDKEKIGQRMQKILDLAAKRNCCVELNTSGRYQPMGRSYPSDAILRGCLERDIPVIFSSDAHHPDEVGRDFNEERARLNGIGFAQIASFYRRKRISVSLFSNTHCP